MKPIKIYIYETDYKQYAETIDQYIVSHKSKTIDNGKVVQLNITIPNLCELFHKLGSSLMIIGAFNKKLYNPANNGFNLNFLKNVFERVEDASQLVQTIIDVCKHAFNIAYNSEMFACALTALDPKVWRCFSMDCTNVFHCIKKLDMIFRKSVDDLLIDSAVEYIKQLDKFSNQDEIKLNESDIKDLLNLISTSMYHNCPLMCKLLIKSRAFESKFVKLTMTTFMDVVCGEQFDIANDILDLIELNDRQLDAKGRFHADFSYISITSIEYLMNLTTNDILQFDLEDVHSVMTECCSLGMKEVFVYLLTIYPLVVDDKLIGYAKEYQLDDSYYVDELEETMKVNRELMIELN